MDVVSRFSAIIFLIFLTAACTETQSAKAIFSQAKAQCGANAIPNRFIVKWKGGAITREAGENAEAFLSDFVQPRIDSIEAVEHDYRVTLEDQPSIATPSAFYADNWGAARVNVAPAWQQGITGTDVIVAVVDSAVDVNHSALATQIAFNKGEGGKDSKGNDKSTNGIDDDNNGFIDDWAGYNFTADNPDAEAVSDHGTHVSGVIAALHNDTSIQTGYVQGIAPNAKILPATFIDGSGSGTLYDAIRAIGYAASRGAKVINASWGGAPCSQTLKYKILELADQGVIFVAASGNRGTDIDLFPNSEFPAAYNLTNQITVGATGVRDSMADFSNYGDVNVHIFAPGVDIISTIPGNVVGGMDGTSMATPFVSGAVALLLSHRPTATPDQIRESLYKSAYYYRLYHNASHGRLNIGAAIAEIERLVP